LLLDANRKTSHLNIMPNQVTEAKFIELMAHGRSFLEKTASGEIMHRQNAGYYFASEASNSLKNVFGDFIACLTDFYDCPRTWERATKKDGKKIQLANVCMNLLAGSTFDYLGKLVSDENIMGGFASRIIYVVSKNKVVEDQLFQLGGSSDKEKEERKIFRDAMIDDLVQISKMVGPMHADAEFGKAWEAWYPDYERKRRALDSEKAQSILARTNTNVLKVAMLLSAAESNDRMLKIHHWERALQLVDGIQAQTPSIFRQAKATSSEKKPGNTTSAVINAVIAAPGINVDRLKSKLTATGHNFNQVEQTVKALIGTGLLGVRGSGIEVLGNPNDYL
jgi:hypothetical protein